MHHIPHLYPTPLMGNKPYKMPSNHREMLIRCLSWFKYWYMLHKCNSVYKSPLQWMSDHWQALKAHCAPVQWNHRCSKSLSLPCLRECHLHFSHSRFLLWCVQPFEKHSPRTRSCAHMLPLQVYICLLFTFRSWYKRKKTDEFSDKLEKKKRAQVPLHCHSLLDKRVRGFVFPQAEQRKNKKPLPLNLAAETYPAKFCFSKPPT